MDLKQQAGKAAAALRPMRSFFVGSLIILAVLLIGFIVLAWADPFQWFSTPNGKAALFGNVTIGVVASMVASIITVLIFSVAGERQLAEHVAGVASRRAVDEVLTRLSLVPEKIFPSSSAPFPDFEEHFSREFSSSSSYDFFGTTAGYCAERLTQLSRQGHLAEKQIRVLILDPSKEDLIASLARKRLDQGVSDGSVSPNIVEKEMLALREEIFACVAKLHPLAQIHDVDVQFHDTLPFFRTEIFETGLFLSFQRGQYPFPGSVYYPRSSPLYEAYRSHFSHYTQLGRQVFSLQEAARKGKSAQAIIDELKSNAGKELT